METAYLKQVIIDQGSEFNRASHLIKRNIDAEPHIKSSDISVITGVRRCGKSTLLSQLSKEFKNHLILYLDLESPRLSTFEESDFGLCDQIWQEQIATDSNNSEILLLVDEVQNITGWERWIRYFAEKRHFKVVVTGSNSEMLSAELGTALGGRYITLELFPFSLHEVVQHKLGNINKLPQTSDTLAEISSIANQAFRYGLFPKPFLEQTTHIYPHLFDDIINRDIVKRKKIRKPLPLVTLGRLLARDNTRLFNLSATSGLVGLEDSRTTIKYLSYFEEAYLFFRLRRYSSSLRKQIRGYFKSYSIDPILADWVCAKYNRDTSALENIVFLELRRSRADFGYWLSSNGYEVDFIVRNQDETLSAIQVCYDLSGSDTIRREVRALMASKSELGVQELIIITREEVDNKIIKLIPDGVQCMTLLQYLKLVPKKMSGVVKSSSR